MKHWLQLEELVDLADALALVAARGAGSRAGLMERVRVLPAPAGCINKSFACIKGVIR